MLPNSRHILAFTPLYETTYLFNSHVELKITNNLVMIDITKLSLERKSNGYPSNTEAVRSLGIAFFLVVVVWFVFFFLSFSKYLSARIGFDLFCQCWI